jgi:predicted transcriptional regulator
MPEERLCNASALVAQIQHYRVYGHVRTLAHEAGVSERTIHRHLSGHAHQIRRGNADRILAALDRLQRQMSH